MLSDRAIFTLDIDSSLYSLGSLATAALSLHLSVNANGAGDALATTHVNSVVLSRLAKLAVMLDSNSSSKVGGHGTAANDVWSLTLDNASVFASVDPFLWALLVEHSSSGEALGVDVSLALLTSTGDALVFDGSPRVANGSLLVLVVDAAEWHTGTAASVWIWNSRVSEWAVSAALGITGCNKESVNVWLGWAVASGAQVSLWGPHSAWEVGLALPLAEVEWDTVAEEHTWALFVLDLLESSA